MFRGPNETETVVLDQDSLGLVAQLVTDGLLFASEIGTPLDAGNLLRRAFRRTLERAELPHMPFHSLRHTSATLAIEAGVHPRTVAERLGTRPRAWS